MKDACTNTNKAKCIHLQFRCAVVCNDWEKVVGQRFSRKTKVKTNESKTASAEV